MAAAAAAIPAAAAIGGLLLSLGTFLADEFDWFGSKQKEIDFKEGFRQALQEIQFRTLQALHARKDFALSRNENLMLGQHASSLAKSRLGVAGTALSTFESILEQFDRAREGHRLEYQEQVAKLSVQRMTSLEAQRRGIPFSDSMLGGLGAIAQFATDLSKVDFSAFSSQTSAPSLSTSTGSPTSGKSTTLYDDSGVPGNIA